MNRDYFDERNRIGSVKAAINLYGKIHDENPALKEPQMDISEPSSRTRELHQARRDIGQINESRRIAESEKSKAESELLNAKKTMKDLASLIQESNLKTRVQIRNLATIKNPTRGEEDWALAIGKVENYQYVEVMRELEFVKEELSKLKLDVSSILEEKTHADKVNEASTSKMLSYSSSVDALRKEIEEVNEEQVLVELARIEAVKEHEAIEAQREKEANEFSVSMEETTKKMKEIIEEIERSKELENKLSVTNYDIDVLQNEVDLVKKMEKRIQRSDNVLRGKGLEAIAEELEAAKKELETIKEEGFQFMGSMDIIRDELKHVRGETARLKKTEEMMDSTVQNLNSKLLRAKSKLESVSAAEEKAKAIVLNLSLTLKQLKTETEAAKRERELINEETETIKKEIQKTDSDIDITEESLEFALRELEKVKSSEAKALEDLKTQTENAMTARASISHHSSSITISKFEYEYLKGRAVEAEEIADKKVSAAQAWVEALNASEKEILMKTELAHRELREKKVEEERESYKMEKIDSAKKMHGVEMNRKSAKDYGNSTPMRRGKVHKPSSPATRHIHRSTSLALKKKRKVMPSISKLFSDKEG